MEIAMHKFRITAERHHDGHIEVEAERDMEPQMSI
jgi:hypothetical protein